MASDLVIRKAEPGDIPDMVAIDAHAAADPGRAERIRRWVGGGLGHVALVGGRVVGYGVLEHSFFDRGFVPMLCVAVGSRRCGIGSALLRSMEAACRTPTIFVSTNESNGPMRTLLAGLRYEECGVVRGLDEGDPEVFYLKRLGPRAGTAQE